MSGRWDVPRKREYGTLSQDTERSSLSSFCVPLELTSLLLDLWGNGKRCRAARGTNHRCVAGEGTAVPWSTLGNRPSAPRTSRAGGSWCRCLARRPRRIQVGGHCRTRLGPIAHCQHAHYTANMLAHFIFQQAHDPRRQGERGAGLVSEVAYYAVLKSAAIAPAPVPCAPNRYENEGRATICEWRCHQQSRTGTEEGAAAA